MTIGEMGDSVKKGGQTYFQINVPRQLLYLVNLAKNKRQLYGI